MIGLCQVTLFHQLAHMVHPVLFAENRKVQRQLLHYLSTIACFKCKHGDRCLVIATCINDLLSQFKRSRVFNSLDLRDSYF